MKNKILLAITMIIVITLLSSIGASFAQTETYPCETCPMTVGPDALAHLKVTDGNGTTHYVECIGCAMKLLRDYDTIHIQTYCDWYGPDFPITADISQHGAVTNVTPDTALILVGGGCTGNRVAYNQTAADNLLVNGYSQYTMTMMQQPLPANTNTTTFTAKALTFASPIEEPEGQNVIALALVAVVGIVVIAASVVAYKKMKK